MVCLYSCRTNFSREKRSLEFAMDEVKDELRTTKNQLDFEQKWKETAETIHKKLLEQKSELTAQ